MSLVHFFRRLRINAVLRSVGWQMLGSTATLGTALWISWNHGLEAQGEFGLAKSWFDAAAAIAALGLPHGLLHLMYRCDISAHQLLPWIRRILTVAAILCLPTAAVAAALGRQTSALVLASLPFAIAHLLARSWLLRERGEEVFGIITAMPALVLLAAVLLGGPHYAWLLLGTACIAGTTSLSLVAQTVRRARATAGIPTGNTLETISPRTATGKNLPVASTPTIRRELWSSSLQIWMQAALGGALPAGLLSVVAQFGQTQRALGEASLGLQIYQVFAVLAGYVTPLLFHRIADQRASTKLKATAISMGSRRALWTLGASLLLSMLIGVIMQPHALWPAIGLMILAGSLAVTARVHGTVLLARSEYFELSLQATWRLLLTLLTAVLALRFMPALVAVSAALFLTEGVTWWRSAHQVARIQAPKPT
ncbi:MAG: hypothetical protein KDE69_04255 [Burkholderiaceae bacterium]|nr:hypothetical protein [Burkholderiaceae bacterium]